MRLSRLLIAKNLDQVLFLTPALLLDFIPIIYHHGRLSSEVSIPEDIVLEYSISIIWCYLTFTEQVSEALAKTTFQTYHLRETIQQSVKSLEFYLTLELHIVTRVIPKNLVLLGKLHYCLDIQLHSYASETMELDLGRTSL
jgi:hypothetical protein